MIMRWTVGGDVTCCRPEHPPHLVLVPGSWPDWWNPQGWHPTGRNGGCCPVSKTRTRMVCTAEFSSLKTSQLHRRKLRENIRVVMWCVNTHTDTHATYSSLFLWWEVGGLNRSLDSEEWRPSIESLCCHTLCTGSSNLSVQQRYKKKGKYEIYFWFQESGQVYLSNKFDILKLLIKIKNKSQFESPKMEAYRSATMHLQVRLLGKHETSLI